MDRARQVIDRDCGIAMEASENSLQRANSDVRMSANVYPFSSKHPMQGPESLPCPGPFLSGSVSNFQVTGFGHEHCESKYRRLEAL